MRRNKAALAGLVLAVLTAGCNGEKTSNKAETGSAVPLGSGFDYYVMALSWSPGYCQSLGQRANREQCGGNRSLGFTVHGLWPNFHNGYPEYCDSAEPARVDRDIVDDMKDIMPSSGLIAHEWKKHGTCSGLDQNNYFLATRTAFEVITIPPEFRDRGQIDTLDPDAVEAAFRAANPTMPADSIAVTCDRRFLRDVRVCLTIALDDFTSCAQVDNRSCRRDTVVVPPM